MNSTYSDNSSTDSDLGKGKRENVSPIKLTPEVWEDIPITKCTALPPDIDGNSVYELPFDANYRMRSSVDGRKWKRYMPSKRFGFKGMRRLAHCAGLFLCNNLLCSFRKQWGQNAVHFDKKNNCGMTADYLPCKARKVWKLNDARETVTVYHYGSHRGHPFSTYAKFPEYLTPPPLCTQLYDFLAPPPPPYAYACVQEYSISDPPPYTSCSIFLTSILVIVLATV